MVVVAQLVRASDCGSEGRRFEPGQPPKNPRLIGCKMSGVCFMFWTYILKSLKDGRYYYGHASDLELRLTEHNKGRVKSTKARRPFVIHYFEKFDTKSEAAKREVFFKSINGYIFLKENKII